jgi:hypothetical protein
MSSDKAEKLLNSIVSRVDNITRVVIPGVYNRMMTRIIKPDVAPGEFKCRTCYTMWSSYMENHILCTDTTERYGLHNFDFRNPII